MAIQLNDNISVLAPKPSDDRYLNILSQTYDSVEEVLNIIPASRRHIGLTVNIKNEEYWFKNGLSDNYLIPRDVSNIDTSEIITKGINLGYFDGFDGVQKINISYFNDTNYTGNYYSTFYSYYIDSSGIVRMGITPWSGNIERRAYIKAPIGDVGSYKSFIWNLNTEGSRKVGWVLVDGNIEELIGDNVLEDIYIYYTNTEGDVCIENNFNDGDNFQSLAPNSNSIIGIQFNVFNNIGDGFGSPVQLGIPILGGVQENTIGLKSIHNLSKDLEIWNDDNRIFFDIDVPIKNVISTGSGASIFKEIDNNKNIVLKRLVGGNNIHIEEFENESIRISSSGGGDVDDIKTINKNNENWSEEIIELEPPVGCVGIVVDYSVLNSGISNNKLYTMGVLKLTTKKDNKIYRDSLFDNQTDLVFIKEWITTKDEGNNNVEVLALKVVNETTLNTNNNIRINLNIKYV